MYPKIIIACSLLAMITASPVSIEKRGGAIGKLASGGKSNAPSTSTAGLDLKGEKYLPGPIRTAANTPKPYNGPDPGKSKPKEEPKPAKKAKGKEDERPLLGGSSSSS